MSEVGGPMTGRDYKERLSHFDCVADGIAEKQERIMRLLGQNLIQVGTYKVHLNDREQFLTPLHDESDNVVGEAKVIGYMFDDYKLNGAGYRIPGDEKYHVGELTSGYKLIKAKPDKTT